MPGGPLRNRITFQKSTYTVDTMGAQTKSWRDYADCWARRRGMLGRERFTAQQVHATMDTIWTIRYRTGLDPSMRIMDADGLYYDIASITPNERKTELYIYTSVPST